MKIRNMFNKPLIVALVVTAMMAIGAHRTSGQVERLTGEAHYLVGFVPGQTLRLSVFNSLAPSSTPVIAQAYVYDSTGRLLAQTQPTTIKGGQFHSFDFKREALLAAGEAGTGRLQVRGGIRISVGDLPDTNLPASFPFSLEVMDTAGGTPTGSYYTGTVSVSGDGF